MKTVPTLFFTAAAVFALTGMIWGIQMSATHDHTLSPAHGHLNLIGFVVMAVFGTYYALAASAASSMIARIHFGLTVITVFVLVPGIAMAIKETGETLAQIGSFLAMLDGFVFVYGYPPWRRKPDPTWHQGYGDTNTNGRIDRADYDFVRPSSPKAKTKRFERTKPPDFW